MKRSGLTTVSDDFEVIPTIQHEWNDLVGRFTHSSLFYTAEFVYTWYKIFSKPGEVQIVLIRSAEGELRLVAPFVNRGDGWLRLAGYERGDYNAVIFDKRYPEVVNDLIAWAAGGRAKIIFSNLNEHNKMPQLFPHPFLGGSHGFLKYSWLKTWAPYPFVIYKSKSACPFVPASQFGAIKSQIEGSRNAKRKWNQLNRVGEVVYHHTHDKDFIRQNLPVLFDMHKREWISKGQSSLFNNQQNIDFYYALVEHLPSHNLRVDYLIRAGRILAIHFGFVWNTTFYFYKPCYDPDLSKDSPGVILLNCMLLNTLEKGFDFDFLKGTEEYKSNYATETKALNHMIWQPSFLARIFPSLQQKIKS